MAGESGNNGIAQRITGGGAMISRQHVESEFFGEAQEMRAALDACFAEAYAGKVKWEYFCVPRTYTYLRITPEDIIPKELLKRFMERLRLWCSENLGLALITPPHLHLMVNGCMLGLHSDFHNGAFGYVYSLTRWDNRKFAGGETLLMRDGVPSYKKHHVQGDVLYDLVPPRFNQLLVFDDRIVHGTPVIEGSMDPAEGRIALVGHIRAGSPTVSGGLAAADARRTILTEFQRLREVLKGHQEVQGTASFRLAVDADGKVESVTPLTDNIVTAAIGYGRSDAVSRVRSLIHNSMAALRFPAAQNSSTIVVPVLVPLPDLRPIECSGKHHLPLDGIDGWASGHWGEHNALELQGRWEGGTLIVSEPLAGSIRIDAQHIEASFDPPMWVPSQRESFETALMEWVKSASARTDAGTCS